MAQTIAERASFVQHVLGTLEQKAADLFASWVLHRDRCAVCSKGATNVAGGPLRCGPGDARHEAYATAEREYARRLVEVST